MMRAQDECVPAMTVFFRVCRSDDNFALMKMKLDPDNDDNITV